MTTKLATGDTVVTDDTVVTGDAAVRAVLADPAYPVLPAPPCEQVGTLGWLRAQVARFAEGDEHDRRRAFAETELARLDPAKLRQQAIALAAGVLDAIRPAFELADQQIEYLPSPNLRIPAKLLVRARE